MIPDPSAHSPLDHEELFGPLADRFGAANRFGLTTSGLVSLHRGCGLEPFECDDALVAGRVPRSDSGILKIQDLISPGLGLASDRMTHPLLRTSSGQLAPIDWPRALSEFTTRFKGLIEAHGPESVAVFCPGQLTTEEFAFLGVLSRVGMGFGEGASKTHPEEDAASVAYQEAFGFDAPPYTFADLSESDTIVLVGSDLSLTHPALWERVLRNPNDPTVIVIDHRQTETARQATLHLPVDSGSELILLRSIARELIERSWIDRDYIARHTAQFAEFSASVQHLTIDVAARQTRLSVGLIEHLIERLHRGERISFWWCPEQIPWPASLPLARAIINLALMTGQIGRPGTGANALGSPSNSSGARLFGGFETLPGGREFSAPDARLDVSRALGVPAGRLPSRPGSSGAEIFKQIEAGKVRGLWLIGSSSGEGWTAGLPLDVLSRLECLVVQETRLSAPGVRQAHLTLPGAEWGEKQGTFITHERRLKHVARQSLPPERAVTDFAIFRLLASAWGCGHLVRRWTTAEAGFQLLKELSHGLPCDLTGIRDFASLDDALGIQWPYRLGHERPQQERRLFEDGRFFHPDGLARFAIESSDLPERGPSSGQRPELSLLREIPLSGAGPSSASSLTGVRSLRGNIALPNFRREEDRGQIADEPAA